MEDKDCEQKNDAVIEYDKYTIEGKLESRCIMQMLRNNYKGVTVEEISSIYPCVAEFIKKVQWWCAHNTQIACFKRYDGLLRLFLYTNTYEYVITINENHISVGYSCRKVEPLEDWNRGNDLIDGECSSSTMEKIAYAILNNEILSVFKPKE